MSKILTAIQYMNNGIHNESTACLFVPLLYSAILERKGIETAIEAEQFFLPEKAYNKPHPGFDEVVQNCVAKRHELSENAMIKK